MQIVVNAPVITHNATTINIHIKKLSSDLHTIVRKDFSLTYSKWLFVCNGRGGNTSI